MGIDENAFQTAFKGAIDGFSIKSLRTFLEIYEAAKASEQPVGISDNEEGDIEYRRNLVDDLRAIHTSAFINDEVMTRNAKADMLKFIYKTCISAANELEDLCPKE